MKQSRLSILAIMAILLTASCSRGVRMSRELAAIDSLMDIKPDSALALLGRMDSMPMRQSDRMFLELLRGKAMNKAYVKFTSDSAMLEVARYFDRHGDTNQRMLAHYVLGCAYRDMGSAPRALEQYQQATAQADTTSSACDLSTLMRVHSQMAELYLRLRLEELEKKEDSIAKQLAWQIGDTLSALMLEEQECNYLYNAGKYSECIEKASLVHDAYLQHGFKKNALIIMIFYVKSYLALGECDKAKYYLDCMENDSMLVPASRSLLGGRGILHYYRGKYYLKVADIDSAEIAFRKALPDIDLNNNALLIYSSLADVYGIKHLLDSVLKYTALYTAEKERRYHEETGNTTLQMAALYDYSVEQKIAKEESRKAAKRKKIIVSLLALFATVFFLAAALWYHLRSKKEERIRNLEMELSHIISSRQAAESQTESLIKEISGIKTAQQETQQEIERLMEEKSRKEQMLAEEQARNDLLIQERNRIEESLAEERSKAEQLAARERENLSVQEELRGIINERNGRIEELERILLPSSTKEKDEQLRDSPVLALFRQFLTSGKKQSPTKEEWENLTKTIEETYPNFYSRTHSHKFINEEEYRICLLVKARFEPTEIESLLDLTYNTVSIRRKRLLKKIFDMEGGTKDFDKIILQIT